MKIEIEIKNGEIFVNSEKIDYIGRALIKVESIMKQEYAFQNLMKLLISYAED